MNFSEQGWDVPLFNPLLNWAAPAYTTEDCMMAKKKVKKTDREQVADTIDRIATRLTMLADFPGTESKGSNGTTATLPLLPSEMAELSLLCTGHAGKEHALSEVDDGALRTVIDHLHLSVDSAVQVNVLSDALKFLKSLESDSISSTDLEKVRQVQSIRTLSYSLFVQISRVFVLYSIVASRWHWWYAIAGLKARFRVFCHSFEPCTDASWMRT
jgi:hypothetical protein